MWTWVLEKDGWTKYALNLPSLCCWLRSLTFIWKTREKLGKIVLPRKLSYIALVTWKLKVYADFFLFPKSPKTKWPQLSSVQVLCISLIGTLNACGIRTPCSKRTPLIVATFEKKGQRVDLWMYGNIYNRVLQNFDKIIVVIYPLEPLRKKVSTSICERMATYVIMFFRTWQTNCWDLSSWTLISNSPKQS